MNTKFAALIVVFCVFLAAGTVWAKEAVDKKVIVEGVGDNTAKGREDAKTDAMRKAIEKAVGTFVSVDMLTENRQVVDEKIYSRNEAYIKSFNVIQEGPAADGTYRVKAEAVVAEGKLKDDIKAFDIIKKRMGNPRLMVIVKVQEKDGIYYSNPDADGVRAKIEKELKKKKFKLVDIDQVKNIAEVEKAAEEGNSSRLKALAQQYGAEVIVTCKANKVFSRTFEKYGRKFDMYNLDVALKAVIADTAEMIYSDSAQEPNTAEMDAIHNAAIELSKDMIKEIVDKWQNDVFNAMTFELQVVNTTYEDLLALQEAMSYTLGVNGATERSFAEDLAVLEVEFVGSAAQFGMMLADMQEPVLKVISRSASKFKVQIVKGTPVPAADTTAPVVTITSPANGAVFSKANAAVTVTGTVDDAAVTSVTVAGTAVAVANGAFQAALTLKSGTNTIEAAAVDPAGNKGKAAVTVTLDDVAPKLVFKILNFEEKTFAGQTEAGAVLTINGKQIPVDANGIFKIVLESIDQGELKFVVTDAAGNATERVYDY